MPPNITIHQINLHHSMYSNIELFKQLEPIQDFITLAQEPHITRGRLTGSPRLFQTLCVGENPRACVVHPGNINLAPLLHLSSRDVMTCLWETGQVIFPRIILISVYWDITLREIPKKLIESIQYCQNNSIPYLCSMDANAHSSLWGCAQDNPRGTRMEEFLISVGADILNKGTQPTFTNKRSATIIDITFVDPALIERCRNWRLHEVPSQSDHVAIRLDLCMAAGPSPKLRAWKTADWTVFQNLLQNIPPLPLLWNEETVETECNLLHDTINTALDTACPKLTVKPNYKLPWWSHQLDKSRRLVQRLHHHQQKTQQTLTKDNSRRLEGHTGGVVGKLREKVGKALSLAPTLKSVLPCCQK